MLSTDLSGPLAWQGGDTVEHAEEALPVPLDTQHALEHASKPSGHFLFAAQDVACLSIGSDDM